jgi:hypothetical protein
MPLRNFADERQMLSDRHCAALAYIAAWAREKVSPRKASPGKMAWAHKVAPQHKISPTDMMLLTQGSCLD